MATITSAASGNFTAGATWVGGVAPGAADIAVAANGHTVTIDADVTVTSLTQSGTGKFVLGNDRTLTGNVGTNAGTFTSGGTLEVTATTTATINGNITSSSSGTADLAAVVMTGSGTLTVNGNVVGGAGGNSVKACVYTNTGGTINIVGNVTGGQNIGNHAVFTGASATGAINVTGDVIGVGTTGGSNAYGIAANGSVTLTVTGTVRGRTTHNALTSVAAVSAGGSVTVNIVGDVIGGAPTEGSAVIIAGSAAALNVTGNVTGGTGSNHVGVSVTGSAATASIIGDVSGGSGTSAHALAATGASSRVTVVGSVAAVSTLSHGINSTATQNGVILTGDMTDSQQGATAVYARVFRLGATNSGVTRYANTTGFPSGGTVSRVSPDNVTGMAAEADVRSGLTYGYNDELEGSLAVPPANAVASGVPVDDEVGTAALSTGDVAALIGAQIAAAVRTPL